MSHRILQGAPTESSENLTKGQISLRVRKDTIHGIFNQDYPIVVMGISSFIQCLIIIWLWYKYRNRNTNET